MSKKGLLISICFVWIFLANSQSLKYDYSWLIGANSRNSNGYSNIQFNDTGIYEIKILSNKFYFYGERAPICDTDGKLLGVFTGCRLFDSKLDTIKLSYLYSKNRFTSFCSGYTNPFENNILVLPNLDNSTSYTALFFNEMSIPREIDSIKYSFFGQNLFYSTILNNSGKLEIKDIRMDTRIDTFTSGSLSATLASNKKDWWVILPGDDNACYTIYKLANGELEFVKFTCLGDPLVTKADYYNSVSFSPDGKYYARYYPARGIWIYDFNNQSGELSNPRYILKEPKRFFFGSICFSPDSKLLYLFDVDSVYQYKMEDANIGDSKMLVASLDIPSSGINYSTLSFGRIGPDGRIYIGGYTTGNYLSVINNPNCRGMLCDLVQQAIYIGADCDYTLFSAPYYTSSFPDYKCLTDSKDDNKSTLEFKFTSGNLYLETQEKNLSLFVYDIFGRLVLAKNITTGYTNIPFPYPKGIYYVHYGSHNSFETQKISVM